MRPMFVSRALEFEVSCRQRGDHAASEVSSVGWSMPKSFVVYDNMQYSGKPSTVKGLCKHINLLGEASIWPGLKNYGTLPAQSTFASIVRKAVTGSGPLVLDVEKLLLTSTANAQTLSTLADWAHTAAPGHPVGYFGFTQMLNTPMSDYSYAIQLGANVEAWFPSAYTRDDDQTSWAARVQAAATQAQAWGTGQPIYFYLWPQYATGTAKQYQYVDYDYWMFQLKTAYQYGDGVVIWSKATAWNNSTNWWNATEDFIMPMAQSHPTTPRRAGH
jgi:hypothetical protein